MKHSRWYIWKIATLRTVLLTSIAGCWSRSARSQHRGCVLQLRLIRPGNMPANWNTSGEKPTASSPPTWHAGYTADLGTDRPTGSAGTDPGRDRNGKGANGPFVVINCAALPDTLI